MKEDWKDALSALRGNLDQPIENLDNNKETSVEKEIQKGTLSIITDKKGRNGKIATIIEGFTINQSEIEDIARKLKQKLGVGGSVRDGEILIQGDHKAKVMTFLSEMKFRVK